MMWTSAACLLAMLRIDKGTGTAVLLLQKHYIAPRDNVRLPEAFLPMYFFW